MAVFVNIFLPGDIVYNKFNRVINKIQYNNRLVHSYEDSVNKGNLSRIVE